MITLLALCCWKLHAKQISHWTYKIFIHKMSELNKATLLCQRVWVVTVLVHHAVSLQRAGTVEENGNKLLQAVPSSEVEQSGKLLVPLI